MRRGKIKRKKRLDFLRGFLLFIFPLVFLTGVYFFWIFIYHGKITSPLPNKFVSVGGEDISKELINSEIYFNSIRRASDSSYLVDLEEGGIVIMSPSKNVKDQISSLQLILSRLTIEGKRVKIIDFRYDRPIVRL